MTAWQLIFRQSKVNGCPYYGEELPPQTWDWPKGTWFDERLSLVRKRSDCLVNHVTILIPPMKELHPFPAYVHLTGRGPVINAPLA